MKTVMAVYSDRRLLKKFLRILLFAEHIRHFGFRLFLRLAPDSVCVMRLIIHHQQVFLAADLPANYPLRPCRIALKVRVTLTSPFQYSPRRPYPPALPKTPAAICFR